MAEGDGKSADGLSDEVVAGGKESSSREVQGRFLRLHVIIFIKHPDSFWTC